MLDAPLESLSMWVRKSEAEIQQYFAQRDLKRKSLRRPFILASVLTAAVMLLYTLGWRGGFRSFLIFTTSPTPLGFKAVIMSAFLFIVFFSIAYYNQRRYGTLTPISDSLLCRECKQPAHPNPECRCQCGGRLEPFDYFDWIADGVETK
jgi:hypothetical protein